MNGDHWLLDANVIIDFFYGELLHLLAKMKVKNVQLITTDYVAKELISITDISNFGINIVKFEDDNINIKENYPLNKFSSADMSVLFLAEKHTYTLITGDNCLRKFSENKGINVHGVLWILEQLVDNFIITPGQAIISLGKIRENGAYLPLEKCEVLINKWLEI